MAKLAKRIAKAQEAFAGKRGPVQRGLAGKAMKSQAAVKSDGLIVLGVHDKGINRRFRS